MNKYAVLNFCTFFLAIRKPNKKSLLIISISRKSRSKDRAQRVDGQDNQEDDATEYERIKVDKLNYHFHIKAFTQLKSACTLFSL